MDFKNTDTHFSDSEHEMISSNVYKRSRDHLTDELLKLDALIHLQILRIRGRNPDKKFDEFTGLYIEDEEVDRIIRKEPKVRDMTSMSSKESEIKMLSIHIEKLKAKIAEKMEETLRLGILLPFYKLSSVFHLSPFEQDTILICLAPELDLKYEKLYAYLQDDVTKKRPSVDLVLNLLCRDIREKTDARVYFQPLSPLSRFHILNDNDKARDEQKSLLSRGLKLDDRITNYLLDFNPSNSRLNPWTRITNPQKDWSEVIMADIQKEQLMNLAKECSRSIFEDKLVFFFHGPYGGGKKSVAEAFCHDIKLPLIIVDLRDLTNDEFSFEKAIRLLFREAFLQPAAIFLEHCDLLLREGQKEPQYQNIILRAIEDFSLVTFLSSEKPWNPKSSLQKISFVKIEFPVPKFPQRKLLWELSLDNRYPLSPDVTIDALANKFRFTGGQIKDAVADARVLSTMRCGKDNGKIMLQDLYKSCRAQSNQKLTELAQKIALNYIWTDIVLPSDKLQQLREICNYVKYRQMVYSEWGFDNKFSLGKGLNILFSGPSGTGKTMAAEIIANELKLDLYKVDLSCVVSKYIGETEKNLSKIFKEVETSNAILFFDEADALFGKRSEVRDSHDRYANIEISYLLQKMEEHEGIVVLASNLRKNMDEAFSRRMHFTMDFPFPSEEYRLKIWRNIFPDETPKSESIDFGFLAESFKISGGNIKNIALNAAFLAAENSKKVNMKHVIQAIKREYQKMGKHCSQAEFGEYYDLIVPEGIPK